MSDDIIMMLVSLELGILPPDNSQKSNLASLEYDDARVMKRKFRKLWKKALELEVRSGVPRDRLNKYTGCGEKFPSAKQMSYRRALVTKYVKTLIGERQLSR